MAYKSTSIRVSDEMLDKIKEIAKSQKRSVNYIINDILDKSLNDNNIQD